jgi:hypothetical protein
METTYIIIAAVYFIINAFLSGKQAQEIGWSRSNADLLWAWFSTIGLFLFGCVIYILIGVWILLSVIWKIIDRKLFISISWNYYLTKKYYNVDKNWLYSVNSFARKDKNKSRLGDFFLDAINKRNNYTYNGDVNL